MVQWLACLPGTQEIRGSSPGRCMTDFCTSIFICGSRGGAMVSMSAWNTGDPWFESRSLYDRFLYVNIHLFIYIRGAVNKCAENIHHFYIV